MGKLFTSVMGISAFRTSNTDVISIAGMGYMGVMYIYCHFTNTFGKLLQCLPARNSKKTIFKQNISLTIIHFKNFSRFPQIFQFKFLLLHVYNPQLPKLINCIRQLNSAGYSFITQARDIFDIAQRLSPII